MNLVANLPRRQMLRAKLWLWRRFHVLRAEIDRYASLLQTCDSLECGKQIHAEVERSGLLGGDTFLTNLLVKMYARCGSLEDARDVFRAAATQRNVYSWAIAIAAFARSGRHDEAMKLFREMLSEGQMPDRVIYISVLAACRDVRQCIGIQALVASQGMDEEVSIGNSLVRAYSLSGDPAAAMEAFERIAEKNSASWNTAIVALHDGGEFEQVVKMYHRMEEEAAETEPIETTLIKVLGACSSLQDVELGRRIHERLEKGARLGSSSSYLANAVLSMYAKCGQIEDACRLIQRMESKDVVSWNIILSATVQAGRYAAAVNLFRTFELDGIKATTATLAAVLAAFTALGCIDGGRMVHARSAACGNCDAELMNALVTMYGRCGNLRDAAAVFRRMGNTTNVVSWNAMVAACGDCGDYRRSLAVYRGMHCGGVRPDRVTYVSVLGACTALMLLEEGRKVHHYHGDRVRRDPVVTSSLVVLYAACGIFEEAYAAFQACEAKNVVLCTAMVNALVEGKLTVVAYSLLLQMQLEGYALNAVAIAAMARVWGGTGDEARVRAVHSVAVESGVHRHGAVATELILGYGKCCCLQEAEAVFRATSHGVDDIGCWTAMASAYFNAGDADAALGTYRTMLLHGIKPDENAVVGAIAAAARMGKMRLDDSIVQGLGRSSSVVANCLVDAYSKRGNLGLAADVFNSMTTRTEVTWTSVVDAYSRNGRPREAMAAYHSLELDGVMACGITFVSILVSCSHAGALEQGRRCFWSMLTDYADSVHPFREHYSCMVDLLARCGRLAEAEELSVTMPFYHGSVEWSSCNRG